MQKYVRLNKILNNPKSLARYQNWPSGYPSTFSKPMNPLDNLDPSRTDRSVVDEYDQLVKNL
jgi:hypothetical protein